MTQNSKRGQYAPKRTVPEPEYTEAPRVKHPASNTAAPASAPPDKVKPVKASAVADETMKRADDYVESKMTEVTNKINEFGETVKKIPANIPVSISEEVDNKLTEFKKNLGELEKKLEKVEGIKSTIDKWLVKGLFFVAGIAAVSIIMAAYAGEKRVRAGERMKEADAKVQYADSVLKSAESIMVARETYHDFGRWMVRRYGFKSKDYIEFVDEQIREGKIK